MMINKITKNILLTVFVAGAAASAERSITDFRVPPSSALFAQIGLMSGAGQWSDSYKSLSGLHGGFHIDLQGFKENDDKGLYGGLSLALRPRFYREKIDDSISTSFENWTGLSQDLLALSYIGTTNWFTAIETEGTVDWDYTDYALNEYDQYISGNFSAGFGFGFGRLRNGTNLWKALEIERILKEEEVIRDDLTSDAILAIAQTVNQLQKFVISHEQYEKYYYQELETRFQELGIDWVPAFVWFKIKEVIDYEVIPRRFGYRIGLGPYLEGDGDYHYEQDASGGHEYKKGYSNIFGQITINSAYPLTSRLQYDQGGRLRVNDKGLDGNVNLDLDYRVSLRIAFRLANGFEFISPRIYGREKRIFHNHDLVFRYYLEDDMYFRSYIRYQRSWDDNYRQFDSGFEVGINLSYYVW